MREFDETNPRFRLFAAAVILLTLGGGIWAAFNLFWPSDDNGQVAILKADNAPYKTRPEQPGGMQIPHQDKLVFNAVSGGGKVVTVERILPGPEQPINNTAQGLQIQTAPVIQQAAAMTQAEMQVRQQQPQAQPPQPASPTPPAPVAATPPAPIPVALGRALETPANPSQPVKQVAVKVEPLPVKPVETAAAFDVSKLAPVKPGDIKTSELPKASKEPIKAVVQALKKKPAVTQKIDAPQQQPEQVADNQAEQPEIQKAEPNEEASLATEPVEAPAPIAAVPSSGGKGRFQLASFNDRASAESALPRFSSKYSDALGGASLFVAEGNAKGRKVFRIQGNTGDAQGVCEAIKTQGGACVPVGR